jgi:SAM-dependent MidA family methyltransferase
MSLTDIIIQRIQAEGPISFHDFMEMALYYPGAGYYTSATDKIGPGGDFYTSSNVSALYGQMIARQLEEMWQHLGAGKFTVVEYGAGTGSMCHDILGYLGRNKKLYGQLEYCIIEKSCSMREKQKVHLDGKVRWCSSIADAGNVTGCILSNELIDNFAVHQVVMDDELMEVFVDHAGDFIEVLLPASARLKEYFNQLNVRLPKGFRTEVNMEATEWISTIAHALNKGYVITIDYGYPSAELYKEHRREGTLVCYNKHRVNYQPYTDIGRQDITTHINFSSLCHWGRKYGLDCSGYTDQASFLLALGIREKLAESLLSGTADGYREYRRNAFIVQQLLFEMGSRFKVLIQQKGLPQTQLRGMALAGPNSLGGV